MRYSVVLFLSLFIMYSNALAGQILNLDGQLNYGLTAQEIRLRGVKTRLQAGAYNVYFIQDEFTAFNPWGPGDGIDCNQEDQCFQGWVTMFAIANDNDDHLAGVRTTGATQGSLNIFKTPEKALEFSNSYNILLTTAQNLYFAIPDNALGNHGGVSVLILPATGVNLGTNASELIIGSADSETLIGLGGRDTLIGNSGADRFVYFDISDSSPSQRDTIESFSSPEDKIDLSIIAANAAQPMRFEEPSELPSNNILPGIITYYTLNDNVYLIGNFKNSISTADFQIEIKNTDELDLLNDIIK